MRKNHAALDVDTLDCCDREAMSYVATTAGITGEDVIDNLPATSQRRPRADRGGGSPGCSTSRPTRRLQPDRDAFAMLKALLRTAAARTIPDLWKPYGAA